MQPAPRSMSPRDGRHHARRHRAVELDPRWSFAQRYAQPANERTDPFEAVIEAGRPGCGRYDDGGWRCMIGMVQNGAGVGRGRREETRRLGRDVTAGLAFATNCER